MVIYPVQRAVLYYRTEQQTHVFAFTDNRGASRHYQGHHKWTASCIVEGDDYILLHNMLVTGQIISYQIEAFV
jgi:hypothetical protein